MTIRGQLFFTTM